MSMTSSRPYLVRALYQWIVDNRCTPHLLIDAELPGVEVPVEYVRDGRIVLNVAPTAVVGLQMDNDLISFNARFGGIPRDIVVPLAAVAGIYARENGQGMVFDTEDAPPPSPGSPSDDSEGSAARPHLKVVK